MTMLSPEFIQGASTILAALISGIVSLLIAHMQFGNKQPTSNKEILLPPGAKVAPQRSFPVKWILLSTFAGGVIGYVIGGQAPIVNPPLSKNLGFPSLISPTNGEIVTSRTVEFVWTDVENSSLYQINVRSDASIGETGGFLWATTQDTYYDVDMGFIHPSYIGGTFYWSVRAQKQNGEWGNWSSPSSFVYNPPISILPPTETPIPTPKISPYFVTIQVAIEPSQPIADGESIIKVRAYVTDLNGHPVAHENVRFFVDGYSELEGIILGADEEKVTGIGYTALESGCYVTNGGCSNLSNATTDRNGIATALFKVPFWQDFMATKPIRLGAWYYVDGGGNPVDSTLVYFQRP